MNPDQELQLLIERMRSLRAESPFVDYRKLKPVLQDFVSMVRVRVQDRADFAREISKLVELIDYSHTPRGLSGAKDIIDFTMREFKWPEVEAALKERFFREPDPSIRLELETLIRNIYDPQWKEGDFESIENFSIWDL